VVPEVRGVQVTRSDEATIVPESPTATNSAPEVAMPLRLTAILEERGLKEIPLEEVRIVPSDPTATAEDPEVETDLGDPDDDDDDDDEKDGNPALV